MLDSQKQHRGRDIDEGKTNGVAGHHGGLGMQGTARDGGDLAGKDARKGGGHPHGAGPGGGAGTDGDSAGGEKGNG